MCYLVGDPEKETGVILPTRIHKEKLEKAGWGIEKISTENSLAKRKEENGFFQEGDNHQHFLNQLQVSWLWRPTTWLLDDFEISLKKWL